MTYSAYSSKSFDTAIIGAGIMGLWAARHAIKRGERVVVLEKRHVGAGASGGFLGALMPHMPDNWNAKKQYQYKGLSSIETAINELEEDTGMDCGFRRCGRIIPLTRENMINHVRKRIEGAHLNWDQSFQLEHIPKDNLMAWLADQDWPKDWLNPAVAKYGVQYDTLAARVDPRAYLRALEWYVLSRAEIRENEEAIEIVPSNTGPQPEVERNPEYRIELASGKTLCANRLIVANGWEAYPLIYPFMREFNHGNPVGRGVKGQALLLQKDHRDNMPIVYSDGTYVVPQTGNRIAIGSTSTNDWQASGYNKPHLFDPEDAEFHDRAKKIVPMLQKSSIEEAWAGVRPRNTIVGLGTGPYFSKIPDYEDFFALVGGFKITFGIAHLPFRPSSTGGYGFFP